MANMVILFKREDGGITLLIPTDEALSFASIHEIAVKDVPHGRPYWVVNRDDLPTGIPQESWEIDENESTPDGYGGEDNTFPPEVLARRGGSGIVEGFIQPPMPDMGVGDSMNGPFIDPFLNPNLNPENNG